jgi:hypothetical protein
MTQASRDEEHTGAAGQEATGMTEARLATEHSRSHGHFGLQLPELFFLVVLGVGGGFPLDCDGCQYDPLL